MLLPLCSHVIWHVKILIHLVYYCSSNLTKAHIKYSPTLPNSRQAQPSLTNEISAVIIHTKQTAPKISEPRLLDLSNSKSACCHHPFIRPEPNITEGKLRGSLLPSIDPYSSAPGFCLRGTPGGKLIIVILRAFFPRWSHSFSENIYLIPFFEWVGTSLSGASQTAPSILSFPIWSFPLPRG